MERESVGGERDCKEKKDHAGLSGWMAQRKGRFQANGGAALKIPRALRSLAPARIREAAGMFSAMVAEGELRWEAIAVAVGGSGGSRPADTLFLYFCLYDFCPYAVNNLADHLASFP